MHGSRFPRSGLVVALRLGVQLGKVPFAAYGAFWLSVGY